MMMMMMVMMMMMMVVIFSCLDKIEDEDESCVGHNLAGVRLKP
jgi:hypothetical protein